MGGRGMGRGGGRGGPPRGGMGGPRGGDRGGRGRAAPRGNFAQSGRRGPFLILFLVLVLNWSIPGYINWTDWPVVNKVYGLVQPLFIWRC